MTEFYLGVAWFSMIAILAIAGRLRKKKPLTIDGWTLRDGWWVKDDGRPEAR